MAIRIDAGADSAYRSTALPSAQNFTIAAWIYLHTDRTGEYRYFLGIEDSLSNANSWKLIGWTNGNAFQVSETSGTGNFGSAPGTGTWFYAAITGDADSITGYWINQAGTVQTATVSAASFTASAMIFGNDSWGEWIDCSLAYLKIWDAALSQAEIEAERLVVQPARTANLHAAYLFQSGQLTTDASGNGKTLSTTGTITYSADPPVAGAITPAHFSNTSTVHDPTLEPAAGDEEIAPDHFTNTSAVHAPTFELGTATATPDHFTNTSAVHAPEFLGRACIAGTLTVSSNTLYLQNDAGPLILGGFHTWYIPQDGGSTDPPPATDYAEFLAKMVTHGTNFLKLWNMETARDWTWGWPGHYFEPNIYQRSGPGTAADGKARFDLTKFDQAYFDRLREYAIRAGNQGAYACVQLFQGFHADDKGDTGAPWTYHPFNASNNINAVDGSDGSNMDQSRDNSDSAIDALQRAYIEKISDTLNDLDNIFFEIENEGTYSVDRLAWQKALVDHLQAYEATQPKQHLVGLTKLWPGGSNANLEYNNEWVSYDNTAADAPATGSYISVYDTDHTVGIATDYQWIFEALCNGHAGLWFMDKWDGKLYEDGDLRNDAGTEAIRANIGRALEYASQIDLSSATPQPARSGTGYCLANTAVEPHQYIAYQSASGDFSLDVSPTSGDLSVEWLRTSTGETQAGSNIAGGSSRTLTPPWPDALVVAIQVSTEITPAHFSNTSAVHAPTLEPGPATAALAHFSNTSAVHAPTLEPGPATAALAHFSNTSTVHEITVYPGASIPEIAPAHFSNASAVHDPTLAPGPATAALAHFSNASAVHAPTLEPGPATAALAHFSNTSAVHAPTFELGPATVEPAHFSNTSAVHDPTLAPGPATVEPAHFSNTSAVHEITVYPGAAIPEITPAHFSNTSAVHAPTFELGPATVEPAHFTNTSAVHAPTLEPGPATVEPAHFTNTSFVHIISLYVAVVQTPDARRYTVPAEYRRFIIRKD